MSEEESKTILCKSIRLCAYGLILTAVALMIASVTASIKMRSLEKRIEAVEGMFAK